MSNGLQTFMRMMNLYNPQTMGGGMPPELPVNNQIPLTKSPTMTDFSMPSYGGRPPDEEMTAYPEESPSTIEAFRQSVLNPPKRTQMTYPKSTLNGFQEALKMLSEPSPEEQNRVYVNGQAYQKQKAYTDPETGERKFITSVKNPSFMRQVLRVMPAAASSATDILNQPYADAVSDWEMKNKGLGAAVSAESQMALAGKRQAETGAIPERLRQGDRALDIKLMDAQTRLRLAQLKDLSDSDKMRLLQEGKISIEELRAANQYSLQELRGEQRTGQITQQGNIRSGQIAQQGQIRTGQITQQGKIRSGQIEQQGNLTAEQIAQRAEEARKTKQVVPGGVGTIGQLPTQQKVALQSKISRIINEHPDWGEYITINEQGFPEIESPSNAWYQSGPDKATYDKIYDSIYGAAPVTAPAAVAPTLAKPVVKPAGKPAPIQTPPPTTPGVQPIIQHSQSTNSYRISYDGGKTWRPYNPNGKQ